MYLYISIYVAVVESPNEHQPTRVWKTAQVESCSVSDSGGKPPVSLFNITTRSQRLDGLGTKCEQSIVAYLQKMDRKSIEIILSSSKSRAFRKKITLGRLKTLLTPSPRLHILH